MKEYYRNFFASVSVYVKMKPFLKKNGISPANISTFIKYGNMGAISEDKLKDLHDDIIDTLKLFV